MSLSTSEYAGSLTNSVLIVSSSRPQEVTDFFHQHSIPIEGRSLHLETKYYRIEAAVRVLSVASVRDLLETPDHAEILAGLSAIILLSLSSQDVPEYQNMWKLLERCIGMETTKGFIVAEGILGTEEEQRLEEWASLNLIEVISQYTCEGEAMSNKIRQLLECAPGLSPSVAKTSHFLNSAKRDGVTIQVPDPEETTAEDGFGLKLLNEPIPPNVDTRAKFETEQQGKSILSSPTRLRRGLGEADVSNLVDELLILEDSDDDEIITQN